jgi:hypothetical protein
MIITVPQLRNHENPEVQNSGTVPLIVAGAPLQKMEQIEMFDPNKTSYCYKSAISKVVKTYFDDYLPAGFHQ